MALIRLSEVSLEYFEHGSGPHTVVLVHGYQSSGRIWHATQQALPTGRYRSIAVNNRGAGASEAAVDAGGDEGLGGGHRKAKASENIARFLTVHRWLAAASSRVEPERSDEKPDLRRYRTSSEE